MKGVIRIVALAVVLAAILAARPLGSQECGPKIKALTYNTWGIVSAKERDLRFEAIGRKIAELNPDIVAIEEAFEGRHRKILFKALEKGGYKFNDWRYFRKWYGSGILFITKYRITETRFETYRTLGNWYDIERLGGKGIVYLRLSTPYGPLDFFHTHALSRSTPIFDDQGTFIPGDPLQKDRLLGMYQIDRFIRKQHDPRIRSFIAAGDFNVSPEMLEYPFLVKLTGFESSFEVVNPGQNPSTFSKENMWVTDDFSRIDHIFYKNFTAPEGFWLKPIASKVEMIDRFTSPKSMSGINYSDHYAVYSEFEVMTKDGDVQPSPAGAIAKCCRCEECGINGCSDAGIDLTAGNYGDWQTIALEVYRKAYDKKDRLNPLLVPMAEVIAKGTVADPAAVSLTPEQLDALRKELAGMKCNPADGAAAPAPAEPQPGSTAALPPPPPPPPPPLDDSSSSPKAAEEIQAAPAPMAAEPPGGMTGPQTGLSVK